MGRHCLSPEADEAFLEKNGFVSRIHRKKPPRRPMPETTRRANALKSKVGSGVEHVFAVQKDKMDLFIRTIGIARATMKIGMAKHRLQHEAGSSSSTASPPSESPGAGARSRLPAAKARRHPAKMRRPERSVSTAPLVQKTAGYKNALIEPSSLVGRWPAIEFAGEHGDPL